MGLGKKSDSNQIYLGVVEGNFVKNKVSADHPDAVAVYDEDKQLKYHRLEYDSLSGQIVKMEVDNSSDFAKKYGDLFKIQVEDTDSPTMEVSFKLFSGRFLDLANRMCNPEVDLSKEVILNPWYMVTEDGKKRSGISIKDILWNDNSWPKKAYLKDHPGMPEFDWVMVKGKKEADTTKLTLWLIEQLANKAKQSMIQMELPSFYAPNGWVNASSNEASKENASRQDASSAAPEDVSLDTGDEDDDLPF